MKKNVPYIIAGVSIVFAIVCLASAKRSAARQRDAEQMAAALTEQVDRMGAEVTPIEIPGLNVEGTNDVAELRALFAIKEGELAALKNSANSSTNRPPRQRESFEERMAKMKAEDPEAYAEMIQRREERQQEIRYNLAERTATFMDLDTAHMTDEELANHELLVEKMARVWELISQFEDPEVAPDREAMRELYNEMRETRPLMDQERTVMFKQLGIDAGYQGEDAQAFVTHIEDIIDSTSMRMPGGGGRGGPGGGGGRGGGGGGGGDR